MLNYKSLMQNENNNKKKRFKLETSLNRIILGCLSDLWLMISLATFSSICIKETAEIK